MEDENFDDDRKALLFQYLSQSRVNKDTLMNIIIPHLMSMGFESVDDLRDLELNYLHHDGKSFCKFSFCDYHVLKVSSS